MGRIIAVTVKPGASKREVVAAPDGSFTVRTTKIPEDGKANEDVVELLAKHLGIAKSRIRIVRGHSSRKKQVEIGG